jgi:hypothetical protein
MISHLCRPFQQNAFSKCYFAGATDAATAKAHTTEPITTEKATTGMAQRTFNSSV